jgi:hypothetical protein
VRRLNQVAISKLRHYLSSVEGDALGRPNGSGSYDAAVIAAVFLGHIAVSLLEYRRQRPEASH